MEIVYITCLNYMKHFDKIDELSKLNLYKYFYKFIINNYDIRTNVILVSKISEHYNNNLHILTHINNDFILIKKLISINNLDSNILINNITTLLKKQNTLSMIDKYHNVYQIYTYIIENLVFLYKNLNFKRTTINKAKEIIIQALYNDINENIKNKTIKLLLKFLNLINYNDKIIGK